MTASPSPPTVAPTFSDAERQRRFEDDGFAVVDLLSADQVAALQDLFDRLDHPVRDGFFATNETDDIEYKRVMTTEVQAIVGDSVRALFDHHRLIGGYFVVKWPGEASAKGPHLDWSLVDEERFRSVSVWMPLVDTDAGNGRLCCVRGSHRFVGATHRGSPDFPTREEVIDATDRFFLPEARAELSMRAGQAVVYSHQTIHFSDANRSGRPRPAVNIAAVPIAADLVHFRQGDDGILERLTVTDGFFEAWTWSGEPPAPTSVDVVARIDHLADARGEADRRAAARPGRPSRESFMARLRRSRATEPSSPGRDQR